MTYTRKPNYGVLFFSLFVGFFFVIVPNIFGYFGLYQVLLCALSLLFLYYFLKSKAILCIDNDHILSSYPYLNLQRNIGLHEISSLNIKVNISFSNWRPSATGDASPRSGYGVQLDLKKNNGDILSLKLSDFCNYEADQVDIVSLLVSKTNAKITVDYLLPLHGGESQQRHIDQVKSLFSKFEESRK